MSQLTVGLVSIALSSMLMGAARPNAQSMPAGVPGMPIQRVICETEDEVKVAAVFVPPRTKAGEKAPVVVLVHDYESDKSCWEPLYAPLHAAGFAVLAVDLRGHGETKGPEGMQLNKRSGKQDTRLFRQMYKDVLGGYGWLTMRPDVDLSRYVIIGAGLGGSVALDCAAHDRSIDGIVCVCPETASLGLDSLADAVKYGQRPLMLVSTPKQEAAAGQLAKLVPEAVVKSVGVEQAGDTKEELSPVAIIQSTPGLDKQVIEFLVKAAGRPSAEIVVASTNSDVYHRPDAAMVQKIKTKNLRRFSSPEEAEDRGLHASRARGAWNSGAAGKRNKQQSRDNGQAGR